MILGSTTLFCTYVLSIEILDIYAILRPCNSNILVTEPRYQGAHSTVHQMRLVRETTRILL